MPQTTAARTRITADEFTRLVDADVFRGRRVELLNGRVHFMMQRERHMVAVSNATEAFNRVKRPDDWVIFQGTLHLDRFSAPDPDVIWLPVRKGTPHELWPKPIVVVEISDTTYRKDAGAKLRLYARHGVPEYWIVNLTERRVEVCRDPQNPTGRRRDCRYATVTHHPAGTTLTSLLRPDVTITTDELLG